MSNLSILNCNCNGLSPHLNLFDKKLNQKFLFFSEHFFYSCFSRGFFLRLIFFSKVFFFKEKLSRSFLFLRFSFLSFFLKLPFQQLLPFVQQENYTYCSSILH